MFFFFRVDENDTHSGKKLYHLYFPSAFQPRQTQDNRVIVSLRVETIDAKRRITPIVFFPANGNCKQRGKKNNICFSSLSPFSRAVRHEAHVHSFLQPLHLLHALPFTPSTLFLLHVAPRGKELPSHNEFRAMWIDIFVDSSQYSNYANTGKEAFFLFIPLLMNTTNTVK